MTVKQFFKSTAFKCIAVLTSILLISGILLAVCWGFMEVTDDERFQRKISEVYPGEKVTAVEQDLGDKSTSFGPTTVKRYWLVEGKNDYIVEAKSKGYNGGITCWVVIKMNEGLSQIDGIRKVQIYKADSADELIGNIKDSVYKRFETDYEEGIVYEYGNESNKDQYINTGASHSLTAVCNCVNASIKFINGEEDPYAEFEYRDLIDIENCTWSDDGTTVTYTIVTTSNGGPRAFTIEIKTDGTKIADDGFTIVTDGSTSQNYKDKMSETAKNLGGKTLEDIQGYLADNSQGGALVTGATRSNELCFNAAAFALANYSRCLGSPKGGN